MSDEARRTSDVTDSEDPSFDPWPSTALVHVEWGVPGALLAARRRRAVEAPSRRGR
jgi:hypothetical protein